jgi:two-component system LytT family response regulator
VRIHRSAIVNLDRIERLEPSGHGESRIIMKDGARLTSSRSHNAALRLLMR